MKRNIPLLRNERPLGWWKVHMFSNDAKEMINEMDRGTLIIESSKALIGFLLVVYGSYTALNLWSSGSHVYFGLTALFVGIVYYDALKRVRMKCKI